MRPWPFTLNVAILNDRFQLALSSESLSLNFKWFETAFELDLWPWLSSFSIAIFKLPYPQDYFSLIGSSFLYVTLTLGIRWITLLMSNYNSPYPRDHFPHVSAQSAMIGATLHLTLIFDLGHPLSQKRFSTHHILKITFPKDELNQSMLKFDLDIWFGCLLPQKWFSTHTIFRIIFS